MGGAASPDERAAPPIELRIREVGQLFHSLDPLPFGERSLDSGVEDFIVGWARELPRRQAIRILIHLPRAEAECDAAREVAPSVRAYFQYRAELSGRELSELFRLGRAALLMGLAVLALCSAGAAAARIFPGGYLGRLMQEGLVILGWVANWRPVQIFLYDWQPIQRRRRLFRRLARAEVELRAA